jgi:hypothetical protein
MRFQHAVRSLFAAALCAVATGAPPAAGDPPAAKAKADQPKAKPQFLITFATFGGRVTKIGHDGFEVAAGWTGNLGFLGRNAAEKEKAARQKPVWVVTAGTLVGGVKTGDLNYDERESFQITDIKVGDVVRVEAHVTTTLEYHARELWICRRPGGKIPIPTQERWYSSRFCHERFQAEQDWEEQRIPIPKKYLDANGHYDGTNPPYPLRELAPMPRPVGAKPSK